MISRLFSTHAVKLAVCTVSLLLGACNGESDSGTTQATTVPVVAQNRAPTVAVPVPDQSATVGVAFSFDASQGGTTFSDADGDLLTYNISFDFGDSGLSADDGLISGTPVSADMLVVTITANDGSGGEASDNFLITISPVAADGPNLPAEKFNYANQDLPFYYTQQNAQLGNVVRTDNTPDNNPITDAGATLGRVLFYDRKLSANETIACASCHVQANGFTDPAVLSVGFDGGETGRHSMRLGNARYYERGRFFWDERSVTLEDQVLQPIQDSVEMGMTLTQLEVRLADAGYYAALFQDAFGDATITSDRIALALAQFVRSLTTYQSEFDEAYVAANGNPDNFDLVFSASEMRGFQIFRGQGRCDRCHSTSAFVSDDVHNNGLDVATTGDQGAGDQEFKAPSLRNVAVAGPYMHDGRFATLDEVVDFYSDGVQDNPNLSNRLRNNNGTVRRLNLSNAQKADLVAFLETLTDEVFLADPKFSDPFASD